MYIKKFNLKKLRQVVPIFGAKLRNEIPGRMRDMSKKVFKRKLISVLFEIKTKTITLMQPWQHEK